MTSLMRGIINDIGDLIRQEIRFAKTELKTDLRKTRQAVALVAVGSAIAGLGAVLLAFMLVHLLHWLTIPADARGPAALPLWACFGIVGALLLAIGSALAVAGKKKFDSFNPLPDETARTVKENVEWITNSK